MRQYLDYQRMIERITHEKNDKIDGTLCGKLLSKILGIKILRMLQPLIEDFNGFKMTNEGVSKIQMKKLKKLVNGAKD